MKVITAINEDYSIETNNSISIFLAGGITNCPNWQQEAIAHLSKIDGYNFTIYNPRRENFPIDDPNASEQQITWEFNHLRNAEIIIFWFASGSLNPIVLYELGLWGNSSDTPILVGCDPEYPRKQDVIIQTALARPEITVFDNLGNLCDEACQYIIQNSNQ